MEILIQHCNTSTLPTFINIPQEINGNESYDKMCEIIKNSLPENLEGIKLTCEPTISITDNTEKEWTFGVNCNQWYDFLNMIRDGQILKVTWNIRKTTQPSQQREDSSTQTDPDITPTDTRNTFLINAAVDLLQAITNKHELDIYISGGKPKITTDQVEVPEHVSVVDLMEFFEKQTPSSSFNEQDQANAQVFNLATGINDDPVSTKKKRTLKRSSSLKEDTSQKKPKTARVPRSQSSSGSPQLMITTSLSANDEIKFDKQKYDAAHVPVLTTFDPNKMIQFHDGIGPITRERHAPGSEKPSCIQAKKESSVLRNSRQLPKFKLPGLYLELLAKEPVMIGLACVMQLESKPGEAIKYCVVGYMRFKIFLNEKGMSPMVVIPPKEQEQALNEERWGITEQLILKIPKHVKAPDKYTFIAYPFKLKDKFDNEMGPVMFRLSPEYIESAQREGIKFDKAGEHCYAAFLFKHDEEKKQHVPDFETLCLSHYEFPKEEQKRVETVTSKSSDGLV